MEKLEERLGELEALLGEAPRASEWLRPVVLWTPEKWRAAVPDPTSE